MTTFPKTVLNPSTPHSLPRSGFLDLVRRLRDKDINAFGFLIEDKLVTTLKDEGGFINNPDRALANLKAQLPPAVREELFPASLPARSKPKRSGGGGEDSSAFREITLPPLGSSRLRRGPALMILPDSPPGWVFPNTH